MSKRHFSKHSYLYLQLAITILWTETIGSFHTDHMPHRSYLYHMHVVYSAVIDCTVFIGDLFIFFMFYVVQLRSVRCFIKELLDLIWLFYLQQSRPIQQWTSGNRKSFLDRGWIVNNRKELNTCAKFEKLSRRHKLREGASTIKRNRKYHSLSIGSRVSIHVRQRPGKSFPCTAQRHINQTVVVHVYTWTCNSPPVDVCITHHLSKSPSAAARLHFCQLEMTTGACKCSWPLTPVQLTTISCIYPPTQR